MSKEAMNRSEDLKRTLRPLEQKMNYKTEFKRTFGPRGNEVILPAYRVMRDQLSLLADNKKVRVDDRSRGLVNRAAEIVTSVAMSESITQYFRDFMEGYLPLVDNWNKQLGKSRNVGVLIGAAQRIVEDMMTMKDTTEVMKRANKKLQQYLQYKPPAFDLSRHYLLTLQNDIEKKEVQEKTKACSGVE